MPFIEQICIFSVFIFLVLFSCFDCRCMVVFMQMRLKWQGDLSVTDKSPFLANNFNTYLPTTYVCGFIALKLGANIEVFSCICKCIYIKNAVYANILQQKFGEYKNFTYLCGATKQL